MEGVPQRQDLLCHYFCEGLRCIRGVCLGTARPVAGFKYTFVCSWLPSCASSIALGFFGVVPVAVLGCNLTSGAAQCSSLGAVKDQNLHEPIAPVSMAAVGHAHD